MSNFPVDFDYNDLVFGRIVVPVKNRNKAARRDKLGFDYVEQCFIGDSITLTLANGDKVAASDHKFELKDLSLTYGQINSLAGDFYATTDPISGGVSAQEQSARFLQAYNTLADGGSRQPQEATSILEVLETEIKTVNVALENHQELSVTYAMLPNVNRELDFPTFGRTIPQATYLNLAMINFDQFGQDARTAYNAGHSTAIQMAISGNLEVAYALNAFADHYLEALFTPGRLRTPRRDLHCYPWAIERFITGPIWEFIARYINFHRYDFTADLCAKYMNDEDNVIGLSVQNAKGDQWTAYGDKRALDFVNELNMDHCVNAVQASADEIYNAYHTQQVPAEYQALTYVPILESARASSQKLVALSSSSFWNQRRAIIRDRKLRLWSPWFLLGFYGTLGQWWKSVLYFSKFYATAEECWKSGWFNYPIAMDGPKSFLPWSSITATSPAGWATCVFYQGPDGGIRLSEYVDGSWSGGPADPPIFQAVLFTPLAAVSWNEGKEIRIYYLDKEYFLQEYSYSADTGRWGPGRMSALGVTAANNTSIAAICYPHTDQNWSIRVYCQEYDSNAIKEFSHNGDQWAAVPGGLPEALSGSSLAVVSLSAGLQKRLYYQAEDLSIKEHCFAKDAWSEGQTFGKAPGCVPISALSMNDQELQLYWRSLDGEIVSRKSQSSGAEWGPATTTIVRALKPGMKFAVTATDGNSLRLYYQTGDDSIVEIYNNNDGNGWSRGANLGAIDKQSWWNIKSSQTITFPLFVPGNHSNANNNSNDGGSRSNLGDAVKQPWWDIKSERTIILPILFFQFYISFYYAFHISLFSLPKV